MGFVLASFRRAALASTLGLLAAAPAAADGWSTTVRRIDSPPSPQIAAPTDPVPVRRAPVGRDALSLRSDGPPTSRSELYAARAPLDPRRPAGPYLGAGVEADGPDGQAAGAVIGGVAAPLREDAVLFGELQRLQRVSGREERRFWVGVRKGL